MRTDIGLDLGTGRTRVFCGRNIIFDEPSAVMIEARTGNLTEYGKRAYEMLGRTSDRFFPVMPVERGAIAEYDAAEIMINKYLHTAMNNKTVKPRVMVAVPSSLTEIQQRSVIMAIENAGARNVCLIESPLATALEVGVDFSKPKGTVVIDIGRGTTDIAAISMGGLAKCDSARVAGQDFDEAIIKYVRKKHNIAIGTLTAEKIKIKLGCVIKRPLEIAISASGLNLFSGLPQSFEITTTELNEALDDTMQALIKAIQTVFEEVGPELLADAAREGIYVTGGGSQLFGMKERLKSGLNSEIKMLPDPQHTVINGIGKALKIYSTLKKGNYHFRTLEDLIIKS